jgi:hypothetical protein
MREISHGHLHREEDPRHVVVLEFAAAVAVLLVIVIVLYMVFTYRPV